MKIQNGLPILKRCLEKWESLPTAEEFMTDYAVEMQPFAGEFFHHWGAPFEDAREWVRYRAEALHLNPADEEARLKHWIAAIEKLFGFPLEGEVVLCGAFEAMDGFARFERGSHRVFLGVDESHRLGRYLDVLETHELTHVARETRPDVWTGWGLDPKMEREVYTQSVPEIEHLFSEGFSCAISEILVPGEPPWKYCYQTEETYQYIMQHGAGVDTQIHRELRGPNGNWSRWYNGSRYRPEMPDYAHYVWAWHWMRTLIRDLAQGDVRKLVGACSKDFVEHALKFQLR